MVPLQADVDYPFQRDVKFPVTPDQLKRLDPRCRRVQFSNYQFDTSPEDSDFTLLADFLRKYPGVDLRIYGWPGKIKNLEFLRHFPLLEGFQCDVFDLENLDGLGHLPVTLRSLHLGRTKKTSFSLKVVERFPGLEDLSIEGHAKDFAAISSLENLQQITLRSITVPSLAPLTQLPRLWSLDIKLGGIRNLEDLRELSGLKYLELWRILGLEHIEPVSDLAGLQYLFLEDLARVRKLPSLARLGNLRRLHIDGLRNLRDLSPIIEATGLEELIVWDASHLRREAFEILRGHPSLRRASIGTGSMRRDEEVRLMLGLREFQGMKDDFEFH